MKIIFENDGTESYKEDLIRVSQSMPLNYFSDINNFTKWMWIDQIIIYDDNPI